MRFKGKKIIQGETVGEAEETKQISPEENQNDEE